MSGDNLSVRVFLTLLCLACITSSQAEYPDRPVDLVLPFPSTGSTDISGIPQISKLARIMQNLSTPSLTDTMVQQLQQTLAGALGQPVNVLRRVSGKTNFGTRYVAQSAADGYTLLFADSPTITVFPVLNPSPSFATRGDLVPVAQTAMQLHSLSCRGSLVQHLLIEAVEEAVPSRNRPVRPCFAPPWMQKLSASRQSVTVFFHLRRCVSSPASGHCH